jgi:hypothetical protein
MKIYKYADTTGGYLRKSEVGVSPLENEPSGYDPN